MDSQLLLLLFRFPSDYILPFSHYKALPFFYLITSPVPTCLVHNCETSQRLLYFYLLSPLSQDQIPFDPHHRCLGLSTAPSLGADRTTERFGTCYKHHSCSSDHLNTTNHPTYDQPRSCTNRYSISNTGVSPSS